MTDVKMQTTLNGDFNNALVEFLENNRPDLQTVLNALEDAKSDAVEIHQNWEAST